MIRHTIIRRHVLTIITLCCLLLIISLIFFLKKQQNYKDNILNINNITVEKIFTTDQLERHLTHYLYNKAEGSTTLPDQKQDYNDYNSNIHSYLNELVTSNLLYDRDFEKVQELRDFVIRIDQNPILTQEENLSIPLERTIHAKFEDFRYTLLNLHDQKAIEEKHEFEKATNIIVIIWGTVVLIILITLYYVTRKIEEIRDFAKNEKKTRKDLAEKSKQNEDNNWVLQSTNDIYESISGIDDVEKISENALKITMSTLGSKVYAGAIYIREPNTRRFVLQAKYGFSKDDIQLEFEEGDGLLGQATLDIVYKTYEADQNIKLRTTFIEQISSPITLIPLHHDQEIIGLIELAGDILDFEQGKMQEYFKRASRTISSYIKFGQNHTIVERLLEQTQKQTEELEVQQEELRITNEELIYKTNLLESSEEELRVQQEELFQKNEQLNTKAEELETKNIELLQAQKIVEQKITEIEQASKYKTEFMANMSHELRTPLNSILILAKLLQDNKLQNLTDEQIKYASVIYGSGGDLLELINQLLDLSKIEAGKVEINEEKITTKLFAESLYDLFKEIAKQKNIQFTIDTDNFPDQFISDESRTEQIIKNFLSNAFKFTEAGGQVEARFFQAKDYLHFEVKDSGKGIPKDKQEVIFEAFRQEDGSTSRKYGGTGLGLTISQEVAILLDGYITLDSELGEGSTFTLIIPSKPDSTPTPSSLSANRVIHMPVQKVPAELPPDNKDLKQRTILIVEDDFNFADILKGFAENYGFNTLIAHDGEAGIKLAKQHIPDAIVLDVMLPGPDGWEVLRTLKSDSLTHGIPVHMMSAADYNKKEILEKGAIGFLPKPVSEEKIEETFSNILLNIDKSVKKILLIDDNDVLSDYIKNTFAVRNINVIQAFTLDAAMKTLEREDNLDCIILDISLPDGNGLKLLKNIKSTPELKHIPVIINTAEDLTPDQTKEITRYTKAMILKNGTSTNRLIDEVNLFLSKINEEYKPVHIAENRLPQYSILNSSSLEGKKVLVVDDDMRNIFALSTSLEDQKMEVEIANNGLEALDMVHNANNDIDIILMDIMMPELDGYETIKAIRQEKKFAKLPIIAVTAKAMKGDREKAIQIGANDYISKPIDINKLISLMQVWLS